MGKNKRRSSTKSLVQQQQQQDQQQQECIVSIASYNILSPTYALSLQVQDQKHLDSDLRLDRVLRKIESIILPEKSEKNWIGNEEEKEKLMHRKPVICLQEIGQSWSGKMHRFFQNQDYHFIQNLYGSKYSDYFGVGIAIPNDQYELVDAKIIRPADWKKWPKVDEEKVTKDTSVFGYFQDWFLKLEITELIGWIVISLMFFWCIWLYFLVQYIRFLQKELNPSSQSEEEPWVHAKKRNNTMILVKLKCRDTLKEFVVSTYHMPCQFKIPVRLFYDICKI
jgi:hypothetical protein